MLNLEGLHLRAALLRSIRSYFLQHHFLEVDTPIRQPVMIPESNIQAISAGSWFLQTSPEQCMKRLLARGCTKIFQICPCFRAEERGRKHLEEFTMLEWYRVGGDYRDLMHDCREMIRYVIQDLSGNPQFRALILRSCFGNMDLERPWEEMSVETAFIKYCPVSVEAALLEGSFDEMLVEFIEPELGANGPLFLYDYPAQCASLAVLKHDDPRLAERFELYIMGLELANGFSELTDPEEQRDRFAVELGHIRSKGQLTAEMPERFLEELAAIEKAAGIAFGLDRFLMLLMSASSIDDVVSFSPRDW